MEDIEWCLHSKLRTQEGDGTVDLTEEGTKEEPLSHSRIIEAKESLPDERDGEPIDEEVEDGEGFN